VSRIAIPPPRAREATVDVPGDKSISHRALMCATIANGESTILNANLGEDVMSTLEALRALGAPIKVVDGAIRMRGLEEFADPRAVLDCGNSGSTMRMLSGLIAGRVNATLDGDESLRRRPMRRVAEPLRQMNADISTSDDGRPPLTIRRVESRLQGRTIAMDVASAQVKTAILFAGLRAVGETAIVESVQTRDHTERMLAEMGADIVIRRASTTIRASQLFAISELTIPGDFSAAFFFIAAAAVLPASRLVVRNVGVNPTRTAALDTMVGMGARIEVTNERVLSGEPIADIVVTGGAPLSASPVRADDIPNLIDEIPALCALAAFAAGDFAIRDAAELRAKESDRIATTVALLRSFGVAVDELPDGIVVHGGRPVSPPSSVDSHGDHRIGMSAAILAAGAGSPIEIENSDCIATSFPDFEKTWRSAFASA
jgi:3-phosphoshikimate 1-carboxyvinyltransferase